MFCLSVEGTKKEKKRNTEGHEKKKEEVWV